MPTHTHAHRDGGGHGQEDDELLKVAIVAQEALSDCRDRVHGMEGVALRQRPIPAIARISWTWQCRRVECCGVLCAICVMDALPGGVEILACSL